jgi:hypothetical protein
LNGNYRDFLTEFEAMAAAEGSIEKVKVSKVRIPW